MTGQRVVSITLPLPPSVNQAFAARRGSHLLMKTKIYRLWLDLIAEEFFDQVQPKLIPGLYGLWIDLPLGMRGDIDNRVKLVSDVLRADRSGYGPNLGIVEDDADMAHLYVQTTPAVAPKMCCVAVVTAPHWADYCVSRLTTW